MFGNNFKLDFFKTASTSRMQMNAEGVVRKYDNYIVNELLLAK